MPRKKKVVDNPLPIYATAGFGDNLIRISWRNNISIEQLKKLNPEIKSPSYPIKMGQKVRLI